MRIALGVSVLALLTSATEAQTPEERLRNDWAFLKRYQEENAKLPPSSERVVFMGNSITEGWAPHFPALFPGKAYIGRGIGGQTTPQMLVRFRQDVVELRPRAVVILAGTNDIAGNTGPSSVQMIEDNLASMAEIARANGIRVVLCSVLPVYDYPWRPGLAPAQKILDLNAWMREYASKNDAVYVDFHSAMQDERHGMKAQLTYDGVHVNESGYRLMAQLVERGIASALGQPSDSVRSILQTVDIQSGRIDTVLSERRHFEAPNWSRDGSYFIVNSRGRLYRLPATGARQLSEIPTGFATRNNNDHGISPDGRMLVISHHADEYIADPRQDWLASTLYVLPIEGSAKPTKVTTKAPSFWHGWSPDGKTLAYVGRRDGEFDIYTIPTTGGEERRLTSCPGLDDGPDYSPDGRFIYYNSYCGGSMQIWRMRPDGSGAEQLTRDAFSNWFPHPSPDGRWVVYLAYLEDQRESHPFGKQVKLRLMDLRDRSVRDLTPAFFGGQGTINVPSWSPDSRRLAFVSYAIERP
jgi:TolB protein